MISKKECFSNLKRRISVHWRVEDFSTAKPKIAILENSNQYDTFRLTN